MNSKNNGSFKTHSFENDVSNQDWEYVYCLCKIVLNTKYLRNFKKQTESYKVYLTSNYRGQIKSRFSN